MVALGRGSAGRRGGAIERNRQWQTREDLGMAKDEGKPVTGKTGETVKWTARYKSRDTGELVNLMGTDWEKMRGEKKQADIFPCSDGNPTEWVNTWDWQHCVAMLLGYVQDLSSVDVLQSEAQKWIDDGCPEGNRANVLMGQINLMAVSLCRGIDLGLKSLISYERKGEHPGRGDHSLTELFCRMKETKEDLRAIWLGRFNQEGNDISVLLGIVPFKGKNDTTLDEIIQTANRMYNVYRFEIFERDAREELSRMDFANLFDLMECCRRLLVTYEIKRGPAID